MFGVVDTISKSSNMCLVGTDKPIFCNGIEPLSEGLMCTYPLACRPVKPDPHLGAFSMACQSDPMDTYFRDNRVGYLIGDSGEPSASANRGGGNSGSVGSTQKRHSPDYATADWRTDRAIAGFGTTRSDSLSSLGKCLASPKPMLIAGYLIRRSIVTPESKSVRLGFGVVLSQHPSVS